MSQYHDNLKAWRWLTPWYACLLAPSNLLAQTAAGGLETTLEFDAPWPPWVSVILILAAAVFTFGLYWREHSECPHWIKLGLASLRFLLICAVIWMMYGFTQRPFRTDLPDLLMIIDDSKSMSTVDSTDNKNLQEATTQLLKQAQLSEATRLNQAKAFLLHNKGQLPKTLQRNYQLKIATLGSAEIQTVTDDSEIDAMIRALDPEAEGSPLGKLLSGTLQQQRGRPVAAVVMLTDGIATHGPPLSDIALDAKKRNIPLHLIGIGSQQPAKDLQLSDLLVDDVVFLGDLITFDFKLHGSGFQEQDLEVTLVRMDKGGIAASEKIRFNKARDSIPVRLSHRPESEGTFEFQVEVPLQAGEASSENNKLRRTVQVRDDTARVLLVQSYPSYEFHYLKMLLSREQDGPTGQRRQPVELSVLLQDADPEFADIDATAVRGFPTREELFEYDVCIFGDVNPTFLGTNSLRDLRDFVRERGRGFVGIAGPRFFPAAYADTPLRELLPFELRSTMVPPGDLAIDTGFRPQLTALASKFPSMQLSADSEANAELWSELPQIYWLLEIDSLKPGVRVLSEHPQRTSTSGIPLPVTMLSYVGAGKVLFHATDDSWRWRIERGDELFGRYWLQSIRYLSRFKLGKGRDIELTSDRETYQRGETVQLRARFFDDRAAPEDDSGVYVMLDQQGRGQRRIGLQRDASDRGSFLADLSTLGTGSYHAWIAQPVSQGEAPSADFKIEAPDTEMTRLEMDATDLQQAADISSGEFYTLDTASTLLDKLPIGRQVRIETLPPNPIWNTWKIALPFILLLVAEWFMRRRAGMV